MTDAVTEYSWKGRPIDGLDVAAVGRELTRLRLINRIVTPEIILAEAMKPSSPLHAAFEWDNGAAASQYRLFQAGMLIRRIVIRREIAPPIKRAKPVLVRQPAPEPRPSAARRVDHAVGDPTEEAIAALRCWVQAFGKLPRLASLVELIRVFLWSHDRGAAAVELTGLVRRCERCHQKTKTYPCEHCGGEAQVAIA